MLKYKYSRNNYSAAKGEFMIYQIANAKIVTPNGIIDGGTCRISDGIIEYVGLETVAGVNTIDAGGYYLVPGFIDIHCHGGAGYDFMDATPDEMRAISDFHLSHGTTTLLATTMTDTYAAIEEALDRFAALGNDRKTLHGVHLEGPWLSPEACGAQSPEKMSPPDVAELERLKERYPFVERISVAPELDGGMDVGERGVELGVVMSVAHTDADFDTTVSAADHGYTLMTHLYSGMNGVVRKNAFRVAGAVEAGLYDDRLFVEIIADGCHLPHSLLRFIHKCKGADRICLITDAIRGAGLAEGAETVLGRRCDGVSCIIEDGVAKLPDRQAFAGSIATADRLLRTVVAAGIELADAVKMLTSTPARVMGYNDRGEIAVGKIADILFIDEKLEIKKILLKGEEKVS